MLDILHSRVHAKDSAANSQTKVFGSLDVDGDVDIDADTEANNTSSGSLVTLGGVGIAKNLHVGGTIVGNVTGDLTGTASQIQVTNTLSGTRYLTFTTIILLVIIL